MTETELFAGQDVRVTTTRFVVGAKTYAINGVTSVQTLRTPPARGGPIILGLIGLLLAAGGGTATLIGLGMIALAVFIWMQQKDVFGVVLSSASGEVQALSSRDEGYIGGVVSALNEALIRRG